MLSLWTRHIQIFVKTLLKHYGNCSFKIQNMFIQIEVRKETGVMKSMPSCLLCAILWLKLLRPCVLLLIFGWWALTIRLPVWTNAHASISLTNTVLHYVKSKNVPLKELNGYLVKETDRIETGQFSFVHICHSQQRDRGAVGIWALTDRLTAIELQPVTNYGQLLRVSHDKPFAYGTANYNVWLIASHKTWHLIISKTRQNRFSSQEQKNKAWLIKRFSNFWFE